MWKRRAAISWDDLKRLRDSLHELRLEVSELAADVSNVRYEWEDRQKQLFRASNRLEAVERRAEGALVTPSPSAPAQELTDPFSLKRAKVRRQIDAVHAERTDAPPG